MTKLYWNAQEQAEHRRLWSEALRSGKYQQQTGALASSESYCCLGVACQISGLGHWVRSGRDLLYVINDNESSAHLLPDSVREWLGLATEDGTFESKDALSTTNFTEKLVKFLEASSSRSRLTDINDNGCDFSTIADLIDNANEIGMIEMSVLQGD